MATPHTSGEFERDVVVIGGGGHVGLPLAIAFADRGARVAIYDVSEEAVERVNAAKLPFDEPGALPLLERAVASGRLTASTDPAVVGTADRAIPPALQLAMAENAHAHITEVKAPHLSMISDPGVVTSVILHAVRATT